MKILKKGDNKAPQYPIKILYFIITVLFLLYIITSLLANAEIIDPIFFVVFSLLCIMSFITIAFLALIDETSRIKQEKYKWIKKFSLIIMCLLISLYIELIIAIGIVMYFELNQRILAFLTQSFRIISNFLYAWSSIWIYISYFRYMRCIFEENKKQEETALVKDNIHLDEK